MKPHAELPYINEQRKTRIQPRLDPPTHCRYCNGPVRLVHHTEVYGEPYGNWPFLYRCNDAQCDAHVGLHPQTDLPLGTLAQPALRRARSVTKSDFVILRDYLNLPFRTGISEDVVGRSAVYQWLAREMGISSLACHWALFEIDQCIEASKVCQKALKETQIQQEIIEIERKIRAERREKGGDC